MPRGIRFSKDRPSEIVIPYERKIALSRATLRYKAVFGLRKLCRGWCVTGRFHYKIQDISLFMRLFTKTLGMHYAAGGMKRCRGDRASRMFLLPIRGFLVQAEFPSMYFLPLRTLGASEFLYPQGNHSGKGSSKLEQIWFRINCRVFRFLKLSRIDCFTFYCMDRCHVVGHWIRLSTTYRNINKKIQSSL